MPSPTSPLPTTTLTTTGATASKETRILYCLLAISLLSPLFILSFSSSSTTTPASSSGSFPFAFSGHHFQYKQLILLNPNQADHSSLTPKPPSIAYFITGSNGDSQRMLRLLFAIYHPRNQYLLHLDLTAPQSQRDELAVSVQSVPVFRAAQNVNVVGKADFAYSRGSSAVASTLHGAAILLRFFSDWDWFINLSAADYPLVTQDDLLHIFSFLPKDLNFVNHTSHIGWRESRRMKPIIIDPGFYLTAKSDIFYATQKREFPNAYRLFTGLASTILNREFVEFCVLGSDNLPRILLMYFSNMPSSQANYFQTILCNSPELKKTIVNHNLHHVSWDTPPKREPRALSLKDFNEMIQSGAAFGSRFLPDDPVLDRIDEEVLNRTAGKVIPGGWCLGDPKNDSCTVWGDVDVLRPGPGGKRLERRIVELLSSGTFHANQCDETLNEPKRVNQSVQNVTQDQNSVGSTEDPKRT
ncbi:PREDICTED: beta-glucuronosyltransferase GlcAT14B-like [Nelumbo nucifera]|uniref:Beta-glucuronosyltransferase GlcAT14A-like n=2 Tax=Nelumbo nucifera TaxID=4432 RepID=A0A822XJG9_NELNU|nr:PREDICTED: beta-glucuronosyltransferase GlcAT14B-like [Nelumbo nucifera]DAD20152.1 TPA_asm: hypothetical protein HUJ06_021615 [Nelumbo nucifera]